jgi:hypothetical protein
MPHDGLIRSPHPASSLLLPIKPTRRVSDVSAMAMRVPIVVALVLSLSSIFWPSTIPVPSIQNLPNGLGQTMELHAVPVSLGPHMRPRRLQHSSKFGGEKMSYGFFAKNPPPHSNQVTAVNPLLDLRVLSTVNQESEHSDCQNTRDDSNQCCRIHRMYPPFSQISCNPKTL